MAKQRQSQQPQNDPSEATKSEPKQHKRFAIVMAIVIASAATGNVLLKYSSSGSKGASVQSISDLPSAVLTALSNVWLILAVVLLIIQFIGLIYAMRLGPLSLVVPLRGGANYLLVALLAQFFLGEQVSFERWIALAIIFIGVTAIGISGGKS